MANFFQMVGDFFTTIFDVVVNLVTSVVKALEFLTLSVPYVVGSIGFLPTVIGASMICVVSFAVIKFICGR